MTFSNEECLFTYRNSIIKKSKGKYIVLSATFSIENMTTDIDSLILKTKDRINEKANREPIGYSFGSTFKNNSLPAWEYVKRVLDFLEKSSDAFYSDKHYNWVINSNRASGKDIVNLITNTQKLVKSKLGIDLENEITIIE